MIAKEKLVHVSGLAALVLLLAAGCTCQKYGEFTPKGELAPSNPAAYEKYGPAMAHYDGYQMAYEWQRANPKLVEEATKPEVLATFVASAARHVPQVPEGARLPQGVGRCARARQERCRRRIRQDVLRPAA